MYKVLLWDIDGTVLNFLAAEKVAIKKCFEKFNMGQCTDQMIAEYSVINKRYWEALERGEMTKPEILVGRFKEFFELKGLDVTLAEAFNDEYQIRLGDTVCFYDYVEDVIRNCKGKYLQCAVTNGTKIAQDRKLKNSKLDKVFDYVFISEEIGAEKPSVDFFNTVFSRIGNYDKSEILIIGDSLTSDIKGGNNAGIDTCWFNPYGAINDKGVIVKYEISSFKEFEGHVLH